MKKIFFIFALILWLLNIANAGETSWTIDTWFSTSWLEFILPCDPSSVSNWSVNAKTCAITCNSWYYLSWNSCVRSSGWWGWGGWWWSSTPNCKEEHLVCELSWDSYIFVKKDWVSCRNGFLWDPCTVEVTWTWTTDNNWTWSTDNWNDNWTGQWGVSDDIVWKDALKSRLDSLDFWDRDWELESLIIKLFERNANFDELDILAKYDSDINVKLSLLYDYIYNFSENLSKYLAWDKSTVNNIVSYYKKIQTLSKELNVLKSKYIVKSKNNYNWRYVIAGVIANNKIKSSINNLEKLLLWKFNDLYMSWDISEEEYLEAISNYNSFVLHFSLYLKYPSEALKLELIDIASKFKKYL